MTLKVHYTEKPLSIGKLHKVFCGRMVRAVHTDTDLNEVTCKSCLNKLKKREQIETNPYVICRSNGQICMDCGKKIKIGEEYWYYTSSNKKLKKKKKKYTYCKPCKEKPEHNRDRLDYEGMAFTLLNKPLFKHEFEQKFELSNRCQSNEIINRLFNLGFPIRKFRWFKRSRYNSRIGENPNWNHGFQPNKFTIYYHEGTENKVVKRLLEEFGFDSIKWKDLIQSLYGCRLPTEVRSKEALVDWSNHNVYNFIPNKANEKGDEENE